MRCKAAADAACARCGGPLKVIGRVNTHRVEWAPGHFFIEREAWGQSPEAVLALR